jgi:hypothetical protein
MTGIFITATPIRSKPRYLDPKELKFLPRIFIQFSPSLESAIEGNEGWDMPERWSGLVISESEASRHPTAHQPSYLAEQ